MDVIDLFPRKIIRSFTSIDELNEINKELNYNLEGIKKLLLPYTFGDNITTTYNSCNCLFEKFNLSYIKAYIEKHINHYMTLYPNLKNVKIKNTSSWINYSYPGSFQSNHIHGFNSISGVLYLQTTGEDGNIYFSPGFMEETLLGLVDIKPVAGLMLVFHSTLPHGVRANLSKNLRVSLSFNFTY